MSYSIILSHMPLGQVLPLNRELGWPQPSFVSNPTALWVETLVQLYLYGSCDQIITCMQQVYTKPSPQLMFFFFLRKVIE